MNAAVLILALLGALFGLASTNSPTTPPPPVPIATVKVITINITSGREQPVGHWTARVGQEVSFTAKGLEPTIGIVGPGLGKVTDSKYGLTSERGDFGNDDYLRFTPEEPGEYRVSQVASGTFLGTLTVTR